MSTTTNIQNREQLLAEIRRLREVAKLQETELRKNVAELREELRPQNILWDAISSLTGIKMKRNEFFRDGITFGLSMFIRRFILKSERKMEGKIYDVVDSLLEKLKHFVDKFAGGEAKREERKAKREESESE